MNQYTWGIDGFGRAFISKKGDTNILLCMLPGNSGLAGSWLLEEQDVELRKSKIVLDFSSVCYMMNSSANETGE